MESDASLSSLLSFENETFLKEKQELVDANHSAGYDEDYLQLLFDRETNFGFKKDESLTRSNFLKNDRLEALTWILKARRTFGFRYQTAYLSMTYFDRFISRKFTSNENQAPWVMELLPIASLTLAAKMEELKKAYRILAFRIKECNFKNKTIKRMELLVLNTLGWKMNSITPFLFLRVFIKEIFETSPPDHFVSIVIRLIFSTLKEMNVFEYRPSVIAIASIFGVMDRSLTREELECRMTCVPFSGSFEIEDVFACYKFMQKLEIPKPVSSPDLRATEAFEDSSSSGETKSEQHIV